MNKKFFIAWIALFVAWMAGSFVIHGTLLHGDYEQLPNLMRTEEEAQKYFGLMLLAHVVLAGAFVWIYSRGIESSPWLGQGFRYGLAVALLTAVPMYTIYYVVQPMPGALVGKQIVFDTVLCIVLGIIVAFLYRPATAAAK